MPIEVITGQPGNGKTLLMMQKIEEAAVKAERPLWYCGIDGMTPGIAEQLLNPRDWNAILPGVEGNCTCGDREPHEHLVPNGSLIFVDEAWKWFGHLHDARSAPTPPHVLSLAEHRHRGLDFVMTTQMSNQLYPFMRGLIGGHTHVARRFGLQMADLYTWGELCDDVASQTKRDAALKTTWRYPKALFKKYTSATQHTIKRKLPWKVWLIPAGALAAIFLGWRFYLWEHGMGHTSTAASTTEGASAVGAAPTDQAHGAVLRYSTADQYAKAMAPLIPGAPWTAPAFQGAVITTHPETYCAVSGRFEDPHSTCECLTEQATPAAGVSDVLCRYMARHGVYNPVRFVEKSNQNGSDEKKQSPDPVSEKSDGQPVARVSGASTKFGAPPPPYGAIFTQPATGSR